MKIYLTSYYYIRFFTPNIIPISTTGGDPIWYHNGTKDQRICFLDKNNVMNGIREPSLSFDPSMFEALDEPCQKNCPYRIKAPNCQFMLNYTEQLRKLDLNTLVAEFGRVTEEVQKANHFTGEPIIALITYEAPGCPCAEGPCILKAFKEQGIDIEYLTKETLQNL